MDRYSKDYKADIVFRNYGYYLCRIELNPLTRKNELFITAWKNDNTITANPFEFLEGVILGYAKAIQKEKDLGKKHILSNQAKLDITNYIARFNNECNRTDKLREYDYREYDYSDIISGVDQVINKTAVDIEIDKYDRARKWYKQPRAVIAFLITVVGFAFLCLDKCNNFQKNKTNHPTTDSPSKKNNHQPPVSHP